MLACQKHLFSIPKNITYLNGAYMSPLPISTEMAGKQGIAQKTMPWEIGIPDFFEPVAQLKKLFSKLVNANDPEQIAIIPSASYGLANAAKNIVAKPGQNIVLLEEQFPSNVYTWKRFAEENKCEMRFVKAPDTTEKRGQKWNEEILSKIDPATVVVALPQVHWADGTLFDLKKIRHKTREVGASLIIDGTQSVGAFPHDIQEIQPDALICAGYKWLLGPYSFGLAYYGPRFDNGIPIEENWINRKDSENFQQLVNYQPLYKPAAHRFCVGENSQFIAVPMMIKSIELLLEWGQPNIQSYCKEIASTTLSKLKEKGIWVEEEGYRGHHLFGVRLPKGMDIDELKIRARLADVYVSFRGDAMRISPNVYNTKEDMERLAALFSSQ